MEFSKEPSICMQNAITPLFDEFDYEKVANVNKKIAQNEIKIHVYSK